MAEAAVTFLRPWWLLGMLPLLVAMLVTLRQQRSTSGWEHYVDPVLQPYVIDGGENRRRPLHWLLFAGWLFTLLLLSGPVWQQKPLPVFQGQQAQVVLFDLSGSMTTDDLKPSRLARARFKLTDLLAQAGGLQVALIAFAERPYVISPLSDDSNTIVSFVESLDPAIMPAQGSRPDLAIEKGMDLLSQAGIDQGHMILFTDAAVGASDITASSAARQAGHRLSVLGIGTIKGAPLRSADGGFVQDAAGRIVVPQLQVDALQTLASTGGGVYTTISTGTDDLQQLDKVQQLVAIDGELDESSDTQHYWVEYAPYGIALLLLASLLFFRKGVFWK